MDDKILFTIGGREHVLRLPFAALELLELRVGVGAHELLLRFPDKRIRLHEVAAIIHAGIVGGGRTDLDYKAVGELLLKEGFAAAIEPAARLLTTALVPGPAQALPDTSAEGSGPKAAG